MKKGQGLGAAERTSDGSREREKKSVCQVCACEHVRATKFLSAKARVCRRKNETGKPTLRRIHTKKSEQASKRARSKESASVSCEEE